MPRFVPQPLSRFCELPLLGVQSCLGGCQVLSVRQRLRAQQQRITAKVILAGCHRLFRLNGQPVDSPACLRLLHSGELPAGSHVGDHDNAPPPDATIAQRREL
jgi:hypothetical protein